MKKYQGYWVFLVCFVYKKKQGADIFSCENTYLQTTDSFHLIELRLKMSSVFFSSLYSDDRHQSIPLRFNNKVCVLLWEGPAPEAAIRDGLINHGVVSVLATPCLSPVQFRAHNLNTGVSISSQIGPGYWDVFHKDRDVVK